MEEQPSLGNIIELAEELRKHSTSYPRCGSVVEAVEDGHGYAGGRWVVEDAAWSDWWATYADRPDSPVARLDADLDTLSLSINHVAFVQKRRGVWYILDAYIGVRGLTLSRLSSDTHASLSAWGAESVATLGMWRRVFSCPTTHPEMTDYAEDGTLTLSITPYHCLPT